MNSRRQRTVPTTEKAFGKNERRGSTRRLAREDHTHGTPGNPTDEHVAEADPHSQYLLKDQSVPQTIYDGAPLFGEGLRFYTTPSLTPTAPGAATWNNDEDCLDIYATNQILQVGQELSPLFKNQTGAQIDEGTPVVFAGSVGASGRIKIQKAIADGTFDARYTVGVATEDIANGDDGHVTMFGKVRGLDTTGTPYGEVWSDGDILYVSASTAGYLTNTQPSSPDLRITVAAVIYAHATNGVLFVRPTWSWLQNILGTANQTTITDNGDGSVTISFASPTRFGSAANIAAGNYTEIEADGTMEMNGDATVWKDIMFPQAPPKTTGVGNPTLATWNGNLRGYSYAVNDVHDFDPQEIEHDAKISSTATFHLHFVTRDNETERTVKWQLEYAVEPGSGAVPSPTTATKEVTIPASTAVNTVFRENITTFTIASIARLVWARLTRIASSGTEPSTDPIVGGLHFHYELDTIGSRQILTK